VTASISADTSGGALKVLSVTSFVMETEIETPDPGETPPGAKPVPIKVQVPVQVAQSNGRDPCFSRSPVEIRRRLQSRPAVHVC
jgi:hypothetical protein